MLGFPRYFCLCDARSRTDCRQLGMELCNQYVLGYKPSDARHNGTGEKSKVKLLAPKGLRPLNVYAETGYYAPVRISCSTSRPFLGPHCWAVKIHAA